jgi:leader peptidase (prepilin peptidase)/N-methyltransferase
MQSVLAIAAAPFVGSFLGVLIRRLPEGRPVAIARSACESCGRTLQPAEMIPLVSYLVLRGKCRTCHARITPFHFLIELAAIGVAIWSLLNSDAPFVWIDCVLGWLLLPLIWIDLEHFRLPDVLTLPLLLCGLAVTWYVSPDLLTDHALAATLGYLAFRAIALGYRLLRGREGLGQGDAKLLGAAGAWVGLQALPTVVLLAALLGLTMALAMRLRGARIDATTVLPLGPSLAIAFWLVQLYGVGWAAFPSWPG